ncbi:toll/interleukin-1 receptor domain-containing protein [Pedobacter xixiisoli]|uniref:TIR domain-containing protein n=1 Tax=Pedobacter xixiisoli TaxID=1476464 RepID=A0A285ZW29_9SPHI|nr:toll/interleukin-1 receptor domain-containing protein [Pedobacter xixiisoli]SOD13858.1 TIR domain-containing protein [Pedobacter xixiisoli]
MNANYYQNQVNRIESDIAALHKKIADETKKELDKNKQINSTQNSITKNTSISTLQSKQRQIQGYMNDILSCKKKIADYQKQIATKTTELGRKKQELRKAEESAIKKQQREQSDFQKKLQQDYQRKKNAMDNLFNQNYLSQGTNIAPDEQETTEKEYDFFISHASEDKEAFVRIFADGLKNEGFNVWYDEFELKIGDSLRKKIDQGLSKSKYGIVVISPDFMKKNWTEYEFNGMIAREMNGQKVILPIWHKVTKDEVLSFSPSLADKMALNTSINSIEEIIAHLKDLSNV